MADVTGAGNSLLTVNDPLIAQKLRLAQMLSQGANDSTPAISPYQGLARALSGIAGGFFEGQANNELAKRQTGINDTLAQALRAGQTTWTNPVGGGETPEELARQAANPLPAGSTPIAPGQTVPIPGAQGGFEGLAKVLASNPDTVPMALHLGLQNLTTQQAAKTAMLQKLAENGLTVGTDGKVVAMPGYGQARGGNEGQIAGGRKAGELPYVLAEKEGEKKLNLQYDPLTAGATETAKNPALIARAGAEANLQQAAQARYAEAKARATETGTLAAFNAPATAADALPGETTGAYKARTTAQSSAIGTGTGQVTPAPNPYKLGTVAPLAEVDAQAKATGTAAGQGGKDIPPGVNTAIVENTNAMRKVDQAMEALKANPDAVGLKANAPGAVLNRLDPKGVEVRAMIADIGSLKLHDRSGAAVSASEAPRLIPFIPLPTDDTATALKKLGLFRKEYEAIQGDMAQIYSPKQGYKENPLLKPAPDQPAASGGWKIEKVQ